MMTLREALNELRDYAGVVAWREADTKLPFDGVNIRYWFITKDGYLVSEIANVYKKEPYAYMVGSVKGSIRNAPPRPEGYAPFDTSNLKLEGWNPL